MPCASTPRRQEVYDEHTSVGISLTWGASGPGLRWLLGRPALRPQLPGAHLCALPEEQRLSSLH